jgi:hypothetical protein
MVEPERTILAGWDRLRSTEHPATQHASASIQHDGAQVRLRVFEPVIALVDRREGVLHDFLCSLLRVDQREGKPNHRRVLSLVQVLECNGFTGQRNDGRDHGR